jgi:hypothetical protein
MFSYEIDFGNQKEKRNQEKKGGNTQRGSGAEMTVCVVYALFKK